MFIEYIYDPNDIQKALSAYTSIQQELDSPFKEGRPADSFPKARKSAREIYRIISSRHWPNLEKLLDDLNLCLSVGWEQPTLLKTRSEKEFSSAVSELVIARHFINLGFSISSFDLKKNNEKVTDIKINNDSVSYVGEVYAPRDWDGFYYFMEDLRLSILHLDIPLDYRFKISSELVNMFDEGGSLLNFDPWEFSDKYSSSSDRLNALEPLILDITKSLESKDDKREIISTFEDDLNNLIFSVTLNNFAEPKSVTPERCGIIHPPGLNGYAPEGMFERLTSRRIKSKIKKKQVFSVKDIDNTILFIDISHLGFVTEFDHPYYQEKFAESLSNNINPDDTEIDLIVFFSPYHIKSAEIISPLIFIKNNVPFKIIETFLKENVELEMYSDNVLINKKFSTSAA